jgi:hypothetical protein
MVSIQQRFLAAVCATASVVMAAEPSAPAAIARPRLRADDPLLAEPAPLRVEKVRARNIDDTWDFAYNTFYTPRAVAKERLEDKVKPAGNVNSLGEVPESPWYTNRHWVKRMSLEELQRGPGNSHPPAEGGWLVVGAKSDGVTPGFTIRDAAGRRYLLKLDPPDFPELASAADIIGSKLFYALGYHTPENYIVEFSESRLSVDPKATYKDGGGTNHRLTMSRIRRMLRPQPKDGAGRYRALASRFIEGEIAGPFRYSGTRRDDPNDILPHEERRELRGLAVFCAWFNHTDSRAINSLDSLVEDGGNRYLRHYLIDFGSSMGSDSVFRKEPSRGHVYDVEPGFMRRQILTLGIDTPPWMRIHVPRLRGVGRFEAQSFDARRWKPAYPNRAFLWMDEGDAVWAAKQVARFTDNEIRALVATARYTDPRAADYVAQVLCERRDRIVKAYLGSATIIDRARVEQGQLEFDRVAGPEAAVTGWFRFNNTDGTLEALPVSGRTIPGEDAEFLAARVGAEEQSTLIYLRRAANRWQVAAIERKLQQ